MLGLVSKAFCSNCDEQGRPEDNRACRVCHEPQSPYTGGKLVSPCDCSRSAKYIHMDCLLQSQEAAKANGVQPDKCPSCKTRYHVQDPDLVDETRGDPTERYSSRMWNRLINAETAILLEDKRRTENMLKRFRGRLHVLNSTSVGDALLAIVMFLATLVLDMGLNWGVGTAAVLHVFGVIIPNATATLLKTVGFPLQVSEWVFWTLVGPLGFAAIRLTSSPLFMRSASLASKGVFIAIDALLAMPEDLWQRFLHRNSPRVNPNGPAGVAGVNGASGVDGVGGTGGVSGVAGGVAGVDGVSGAGGASGVAGVGEVARAGGVEGGAAQQRNVCLEKHECIREMKPIIKFYRILMVASTAFHLEQARLSAIGA